MQYSGTKLNSNQQGQQSNGPAQRMLVTGSDLADNNLVTVNGTWKRVAESFSLRHLLCCTCAATDPFFLIQLRRLKPATTSDLYILMTKSFHSDL
jgi:hypothetical protein